MEKNSQKSLLDVLIDMMPDMRDQLDSIRLIPRNAVNGKAAKALFSLWKDESNKLANKTLKRPVNVSLEDINAMQQAGLVKNLGEKIEVTAKGAEIIRTMILGDEKSAFEDDGEILPYERAFANTKTPVRTAKGKSKRLASQEEQSSNWYQRMRQL